MIKLVMPKKEYHFPKTFVEFGNRDVIMNPKCYSFGKENRVTPVLEFYNYRDGLPTRTVPDEVMAEIKDREPDLIFAFSNEESLNTVQDAIDQMVWYSKRVFASLEKVPIEELCKGEFIQTGNPEANWWATGKV